MLKSIRIENIILIEKGEMFFTSGFNILTGETGSGKSSIMKGLRLALGERADTTVIRHGCEKGSVEAIFNLDFSPNLHSILNEGGISHEPGDELIIRREISSSSKGRVFINNQAAQLSFLKKIGDNLLQIVGQRANQQLFNLDYHREVVSLYGDLNPLENKFQSHFEKITSLKKELDTLKQQETQRIRDIDRYRQELQELAEASLKEGEDEELFSEYALLCNVEEISTKLEEVYQALSNEKQSVLGTLSRQKQTLQSIVKYDPQLEEVFESFQNAFLELQEIAHTLSLYQGHLPADPLRLNEVNERLTQLNRLKRKYGESVTAILVYEQDTKERLHRLENGESEIERLENEIAEMEEIISTIAQELTTKRTQVATVLEHELSKQLHSLNMQKAQFKIYVTPQKRSSLGDDRVEFFISPNIGEQEIPLRESASGGEISRVLLALHTLLADKGNRAALIFDEIDANIGGETAKIVGEKLKTIGANCQVICITHFPQVASQADHHLQTSKEEREGRTVTRIEILNRDSRERELSRMTGKR